MKKMAVIVITGLLLSIPVYRVLAETCSCTATDGSCSAGISCSGGCIAYCPSGGCYARCSGQHLLIDFSQEISMQMRDSSSRQLSSELARITGEEIVVSPKKPNETYTFDFKNALLWDVLEVLSDRGKVQIAGEDFGKLLRIRKAFLSGEKMSVCIRKTPVRYIIDELSALSGEQIHITSGNINALVTLSLKDVTLKEVVAKLSEQTGAKIEGIDLTGQ
jgi:type II secretory pathway component GspD/PulD (secretin)